MADEGGQLWNMEIKDGRAEQEAVERAQHEQAAAQREAMYSYLHAGEPYGVTRSLHVAGGYKSARHVYTGSNPHNHRHSYQGRRHSRNYGHRYTSGNPTWDPGHSQGVASDPWGPLGAWFRWLLGIDK
jgi:hypothetical protein